MRESESQRISNMGVSPSEILVRIPFPQVYGVFKSIPPWYSVERVDERNSELGALLWAKWSQAESMPQCESRSSRVDLPSPATRADLCFALLSPFDCPLVRSHGCLHLEPSVGSLNVDMSTEWDSIGIRKRLEQ